jgi:predicted transcriptional regulator
MTQNLSRDVAAVIRAEMARERIPQTRLADALDLSNAAVSRRLSGQTAFELDELPVVAQLLGVDVNTLISGGAA